MLILTKYLALLLWVYRKFSNKRTGCYDMPLGDASRLWRTFSPSRGLLQNENRTIISWDMGKNVKIDRDRVRKNKGCLYWGRCLYWRIYGIPKCVFYHIIAIWWTFLLLDLVLVLDDVRICKYWFGMLFPQHLRLVYWVNAQLNNGAQYVTDCTSN